MGKRRRGSPRSSPTASFSIVALPSLVSRDRAFFDLFSKAGQNTLRASRLLKEMLERWPDERELARDILLAEQEGDKITHEIIQRVQTASETPLDGEDIYALATKLDDIVDYIEEAADFLGLYQIEAPMEQSVAMADVLIGCCEQLAAALSDLRGFKDLEHYWIEIHRLENDGDRLYRDAVASLFAGGIDPMVVIRWKDIFTVLERAVDGCETAAHIIEGIVIKNA
jgi:predicted phosphate transport protein (TIGR00153 family)